MLCPNWGFRPVGGQQIGHGYQRWGSNDPTAYLYCARQEADGRWTTANCFTQLLSLAVVSFIKDIPGVGRRFAPLPVTVQFRRGFSAETQWQACDICNCRGHTSGRRQAVNDYNVDGRLLEAFINGEINCRFQGLSAVPAVDAVMAEPGFQNPRPGEELAVVLSHNAITSITAGHVEQVTLIETLYVDHNQLTSWPQLRHAQLRVLDIGQNPITSLQPGVFDLLPRLESIRLEGMSGLFALPRGLFNAATTPQLVSVRLNDAPLIGVSPKAFTGRFFRANLLGDAANDRTFFQQAVSMLSLTTLLATGQQNQSVRCETKLADPACSRIAGSDVGCELDVVCTSCLSGVASASEASPSQGARGCVADAVAEACVADWTRCDRQTHTASQLECDIVAASQSSLQQTTQNSTLGRTIRPIGVVCRHLYSGFECERAVWGTIRQESDLYPYSEIVCDPDANGDDAIGNNADGSRDDEGESSTAAVAAAVSVVGLGLLAGIVTIAVRRHRTKLQVKKGAFFLDEMVRKVAEQVQKQLVAQWKHVLLRVDRDLEAATIAAEQAFDLLRVDASELDIDPAQSQGRGKLGDVSLGHLRRSTPVVIEVVSRRDKDSLAGFLLDAKVMHLLKHEHIVKVVAVVDRELPMMLALEHMPGGNLRQHLKDCRPSMGPGRKAIITDKDLHDWIAQLAAAGEFLESRKVIHRSLKAENVLLSADTRTAKLANFGETREIYEAEQYVARNFKESLQQQLAVRWMAPETVAEGVYTPFTDMWSFGILIWEITTFGKTPYGALNAQEIVADISSGRRLQPPMTCSQPTAELIVSCWHEVPTQRCKFGDIRANIALQRLPGGARHLESQARARLFSASEMAVQTIPASAFEPASLLLAKGGLFNRRLVQWKPRAGEHDPASPRFSIGVSVADTGNRVAGQLLRADLAYAQMLPSADRTLAFQGLCSHPVHGTTIVYGWGLGDPTTLMKTAIPLAHRPRAVLDIALGLEHIHASRLVMKNLSPTIAITAAPHYRVKLLVTEVASISGDTMGTVDVVVARDDLWWQAPETIAAGTLSRASNVWTFGTMVYHMFNFEADKAPLMKRFPGEQAMVQEVQEVGGQLPPLELKSAGPVFEELVQACQQQDPKSRATTPDLIDRLEVHMSQDSARWEVQRSWLEQLRLLGDGEFGDVVLMMLTRPNAGPSTGVSDRLDAADDDGDGDGDGSDDITQMMVAGKTLKQGVHSSAHASFLRELEIMKRLRHPHLVTLIGAVTKDTPLLILLEYSVGGDLEGWVYRNASQVASSSPLLPAPLTRQR